MKYATTADYSAIFAPWATLYPVGGIVEVKDGQIAHKLKEAGYIRDLRDGEGLEKAEEPAVITLSGLELQSQIYIEGVDVQETAGRVWTPDGNDVTDVAADIAEPVKPAKTKRVLTEAQKAKMAEARLAKAKAKADAEADAQADIDAAKLG